VQWPMCCQVPRITRRSVQLRQQSRLIDCGEEVVLVAAGHVGIIDAPGCLSAAAFGGFSNGSENDWDGSPGPYSA
jgi:hypothetical protein